MEITRDQLKEQMESIKDSVIDLFLEIDMDKATAIILANDGTIKVSGVSLESLSDQHAVIEINNENGNVWHRVELRLCHRNLPIAKCDCERGQKYIRCEHLIKAFHAFVILRSYGMIKRITKRSQCLWMPLTLQKG